MTLYVAQERIEEEELEVLYPLELKPYVTREVWCFDPDGSCWYSRSRRLKKTTVLSRKTMCRGLKPLI